MELTDLGHVESGVLFSDVLDDQFPLIGADMLDRDARIVRHHRQVDCLDGFRVGFDPTDLLSRVHQTQKNKESINNSANTTKKSRRLLTIGSQQREHTHTRIEPNQHGRALAVTSHWIRNARPSRWLRKVLDVQRGTLWPPRWVTLQLRIASRPVGTVTLVIPSVNSGSNPQPAPSK